MPDEHTDTHNIRIISNRNEYRFSNVRNMTEDKKEIDVRDADLENPHMYKFSGEMYNYNDKVICADFSIFGKITLVCSNPSSKA